MADDTTISAGTGGDVIATDHVSTLNGAAVTPSATTPKVQRVKVAYGDDGTSRDVSTTFPLPVTNASLPLPTGAATTAAQTDGTQKAINRGGAKGTTAAADVTSTAEGANNQALDVQVYHGGAAVDPRDVSDRAGRALGVVASITNALPAGTNNIGDVDVLTLPAIPAGANTIGTTLGPAITKGTQGTTGYAVQDLKDAGRAPVTYYMAIPVLATATDTLQSLTGTKANATVVATATPAVVTAGKTFRIQRMWATYIATATSGYAIVRLRYNTAGVVAATSPILLHTAVGAGTPATANSVGIEDSTVPDGLEVPAGTGIGITVQGFAAATATAVGYVLCGVSGYEY